MVGGGYKSNTLTGFTVAPDLKTAQYSLLSENLPFFHARRRRSHRVIFLLVEVARVCTACRTRFGTRDIKEMDMGVEALFCCSQLLGLTLCLRSSSRLHRVHSAERDFSLTPSGSIRERSDQHQLGH